MIFSINISLRNINNWALWNQDWTVTEHITAHQLWHALNISFHLWFNIGNVTCPNQYLIVTSGWSPCYTQLGCGLILKKFVLCQGENWINPPISQMNWIRSGLFYGSKWEKIVIFITMACIQRETTALSNNLKLDLKTYLKIQWLTKYYNYTIQLYN